LDRWVVIEEAILCFWKGGGSDFLPRQGRKEKRGGVVTTTWRDERPHYSVKGDERHAVVHVPIQAVTKGERFTMKKEEGNKQRGTRGNAVIKGTWGRREVTPSNK